MRIYLTSSENRNKFGISKVISQLQKRFKKSEQIRYSKNLIEFFIFRPKILHIHGCWKIRLILFFLLAKIMGVKIVISPHGMMDQNSLNQKKTKKKLALFFYQKLIFKKADLIIVNSIMEKKNFLIQVPKLKKIKIIPHGVNIDKKFFPKKNLKKDLKFVFFSKIHKSKNLLLLLRLWEKSNFLKKFNLDIIGETDDESYFVKINKVIRASSNIKYLGSLNKKIQYKLSKYDVFIHPSKSENFGLVIYEALSSGLFLILNKELKKKELTENKFAVSINFDLETIIKTIKQILNNKKYIKSLNYKKKCFHYVKKNYNWDFISKDYLKNYLRILNRSKIKI